MMGAFEDALEVFRRSDVQHALRVIRDLPVKEALESQRLISEAVHVPRMVELVRELTRSPLADYMERRREFQDTLRSLTTRPFENLVDPLLIHPLLALEEIASRYWMDRASRFPVSDYEEHVETIKSLLAEGDEEEREVSIDLFRDSVPDGPIMALHTFVWVGDKRHASG